ncbi:hypothetical protein PC118_g4408 [Phytophthora cactorum]|nr:hypothetical protein PC118_g4408 [Phytophthora cactorum]KAG3179884.1 hypothetical protein C6341_g7235 [Phytophthora cactorum]
MRELIRQKPFEAKRGATLEVWDNVAAALSTALQQKVKVKQIRDRLNLLKARLKANEQAPFSASGVEESLDAVSIQSHYSDVDGKKKKEEDLAKCAAGIVAESRRRRIERDVGQRFEQFKGCREHGLSNGKRCVCRFDQIYHSAHT